LPIFNWLLVSCDRPLPQHRSNDRDLYAWSKCPTVKSDNPSRKLSSTWEMIQVCDNEPTWVGVNTALPNRVIKLGLENPLFRTRELWANPVWSTLRQREEKPSRLC
jgi:hypothetical protein